MPELVTVTVAGHGDPRGTLTQFPGTEKSSITTLTRFVALPPLQNTLRVLVPRTKEFIPGAPFSLLGTQLSPLVRATSSNVSLGRGSDTPNIITEAIVETKNRLPGRANPLAASVLFYLFMTSLYIFRLYVCRGLLPTFTPRARLWKRRQALLWWKMYLRQI